MRDWFRALLPRLHLLPALSEQLDQWAEWLVRTRFAHLSEAERAETLARLEHVRDRVLDTARLCAGETFVDVGAGTGLLTLGAAPRLGDGDALAVDVSADALEELRRVCTDANVAYLIGNAEVLPLMDRTADSIATRSVLIYVKDKPEAAREFFRVLRSGGRVSVYEPINRRSTRIWEAVEFGDLRERVIAEFDEEWPPDDPIHDFDEDDLVRVFESAGFGELAIEHDEVVDEIAPGRMLTGVGAPGHKSIGDRWRAAFAPAEVDRLERAVHAAGTITYRVPTVLLSGVKP